MVQPPDAPIDPETWLLLAPEAFEAERSERRPIRRTGLALATAIAVFALGIWSGLWTPALAANGNGSGGPDTGDGRKGTAEMAVRNNRATAVTIDGAGTTDLAGVQILRASTGGPVAGMSEGMLHVEFRVDCAMVPRQLSPVTPSRLTVTAKTWRGDVPVDVSGETLIGWIASSSICGS